MTHPIEQSNQQPQSWTNYPEKLFQSVSNTYQHYYVRPIDEAIEQLSLDAVDKGTLKKVCQVAPTAIAFATIELLMENNLTRLNLNLLFYVLGSIEPNRLGSRTLFNTVAVSDLIFGTTNLIMAFSGNNPIQTLPTGVLGIIKGVSVIGLFRHLDKVMANKQKNE